MRRWLVVVVLALVPGGALVAGLWWWMRRRAASTGPKSRWASQAHRDQCDPVLVAKVDALLAAADAAARPFVVTDGFRSNEAQDALAAGGSLAAGGVTNAKGGQSPHNYGCAADLAPMDANGRPTWSGPESDWAWLRDKAESLGLVSGARWSSPDRPHVELPDWKARRAAREAVS